MGKKKERAEEIEFLQYFYQEADFGPADGDVRYTIKQNFMDETGKRLPKEYEDEE